MDETKVSKTTVYRFDFPVQIDFTLLCQQKQALVKAVAAGHDVYGVLGIIEEIQRAGVRLGVPASEVYLSGEAANETPPR